MCISWMRAVVEDGTTSNGSARSNQSLLALSTKGRPNQLHLKHLLKGQDDIGAAAGGGDAERDIAGLAERLDLAGEQMLEPEIVSDRRQSRGVCGQGDCREGRTVLLVPHREFGREVLRVGGAAAVAEEEHLSTVAEGRDTDLDERGERAPQSASRVAARRSLVLDAGSLLYVRREIWSRLGAFCD